MTNDFLCQRLSKLLQRPALIQQNKDMPRAELIICAMHNRTELENATLVAGLTVTNPGALHE